MRKRDVERLYDYLPSVVEEVLLGDGSLVTPGEQVWRPEVVEEVYEHVVGAPDPGSGSFLEKLEQQVGAASRSAKQLVAELLVVYYLPCAPVAVSPGRKREQIEQALSWSRPDVFLPQQVLDVLDEGLWHPGTWYLTRADAQLTYLIEFARAFKRLEDSQKQRLVEDAWVFKDFVFGLKPHQAHPTHHGLLHMLHPDKFEPIVAVEAKRKIAVRFADEVAEPTNDLDRQLLQIREALTPTFGEGFDFYDPEVRAKWQPDASPWGQFVDWAGRLYEAERFESWERTWKIEAARELEDVRTTDNVDPMELIARVTKIIQKGSLVDYRIAGSFKEWMQAQPETSVALVRQLWAEPDDKPTWVRFEDALDDPVPPGTGGRASLLAALLLDEEHPPFRPSFLTKANLVYRSRQNRPQRPVLCVLSHILHEDLLVRSSKVAAISGGLRHPSAGMSGESRGTSLAAGWAIALGRCSPTDRLRGRLSRFAHVEGPSLATAISELGRATAETTSLPRGQTEVASLSRAVIVVGAWTCPPPRSTAWPWPARQGWPGARRRRWGGRTPSDWPTTGA